MQKMLQETCTHDRKITVDTGLYSTISCLDCEINLKYEKTDTSEVEEKS